MKIEAVRWNGKAFSPMPLGLLGLYLYRPISFRWVMWTVSLSYLYFPGPFISWYPVYAVLTCETRLGFLNLPQWEKPMPAWQSDRKAIFNKYWDISSFTLLFNLIYTQHFSVALFFLSCFKCPLSKCFSWFMVSKNQLLFLLFNLSFQ